ncbi:MAG: glycoside hydrolase family 31 protein [Lachnospiraceae bacterium]|nr:glycoside hydrolase family 31 protein [Lachnospiraceae bacterium]
MKIQLTNGQTTLLTDTLQIDALTDSILRIRSVSGHTERLPLPQNTTSYAIENLPENTGNFYQKGVSNYHTDQLQIRISPQNHLSITTTDGKILCEDYLGVIDTKEDLSPEERDLMAQEGHAVPDADTPQSYQIYKKLYGDEHFYGLGDKTGYLDKKGYDYIMWNSDLPDPQVENPTFRALYKSIPFLIVLRQDCVYGIFVDNPHKTYFDLGYESSEYYSFSAAKGALDYYFIYGSTMIDVISSYTSLTGRAPLPQLWTLGYHQSRWSYASAEEVLDLAKTFRKLQIPCDAIHLDIDYMDAFKVFTVDDCRFPDLTALSDTLEKMGIKLVTIIDPGVKAESGYSLYDTGLQNHFFAQTPEGEVYHNVVWPGDSVFPDFTSATVRNWWAEQTKFQAKHHIRGIWNDMNEPASFRGPLPDDVVFPGDPDTKPLLHEDIHNVYGHLMAKATYDGLQKNDGRRPFVITRACYSGTQKYATVWTGDNQSLWCHLKMSIPQLLNLGLSGQPLAGTDIGGFGANTTPELLCRWIEASCFAPLFRNHSAKYTRRQEPWQFDQQTLDINRKYIQLHYHFLPYLYDLCYQETKTGLPILRPLVLHYSNDPHTAQCNDEYLVGDKLLVAPITDQGATARSVYLPEGLWINYWDNTRIQGGRYILQEAPLDYCPIYVKAGSILPTYPAMNFIHPSALDTLQLQIYPDDHGNIVPYEHYQDNGEDFAYQQGEYNLYCFDSLSETGNIFAEDYLLHSGYQHIYSHISTIVH